MPNGSGEGQAVNGTSLGLSASLIMAAIAVSGQAAPPPLIIAHRGASGYRPEHTIEAYTLAIEQGADVIEPDLVITKDGVLVARHENEIGSTTDVASKFPERRATRRVDGEQVTGWFAEDFTLAELKTLRARERLAFRSHAFDGQFSIPTFEEILTLAASKSRDGGQPIAVYPETKHPSYLRGIGLPLEERLVRILAAHDLTRPTDPVFVQSFEADSLRRLRPLTRVRLVQLLDEGSPPADLRAIATYANGIGANKRLVVPAAADGTLLPPTDLVRRAHAAGLFVHVWTLRSEPVFLSPSYSRDPAREYRQFADLGVDGLFTDFPDIAVRILRPAVR